MPSAFGGQPPLPERAHLVAELLEPECPLGQAYAALLARARQSHLDVAIEAAPFARHVASVLDLTASDRSVALAELRAGDLYLACGAVLGNPSALARFDRQYLQTLKSFVREIDTSEARLDELRQALRERLLVGPAGAPPRLAKYAGKGALAAWVGVAARRLALSSLGSRQHEQADGDAALAQCVAPASSADVVWARLQHADQFKAAILAALDVLEPRQRLILRLHLVDGVSLSRIAVSYAVSQSTVSRWFERARQRVRRETKHRLRTTGGLDSSEIASLARDLENHLDLGISSVLAPARDVGQSASG
jgi:RNA polymerase sigma-70 factor, ECF subfamily